MTSAVRVTCSSPPALEEEHSKHKLPLATEQVGHLGNGLCAVIPILSHYLIHTNSERLSSCGVTPDDGDSLGEVYSGIKMSTLTGYSAFVD